MFEHQTILITGGTGSWGYALTQALLKFDPKEIRIFSRNEFAQVRMQQAFQGHPTLKFIIGDVRDYTAVRRACDGVDTLFHLAALKHVPICERQPDETLKTNVLGTQNIIRASVECNVKKVVDVSTDKAVEPVNFYGMTKALGEKMILQADQTSDTTQFVCVRGGNVLGSNGSVVPLFIHQIQKYGKITLTSTEMTRFFLTLEEAIGLLIQAATISVGGEIFVMKMKSCKISLLAEVLATHYCDKDVKILDIGVRAGEKLHEVLVSRYEAPTTYQYSEAYYVILPMHPSQDLIQRYRSYPSFAYESFESSQELMPHEEIQQMLKRGGFLQ